MPRLRRAAALKEPPAGRGAHEQARGVESKVVADAVEGVLQGGPIRTSRAAQGLGGAVERHLNASLLFVSLAAGERPQSETSSRPPRGDWGSYRWSVQRLCSVVGLGARGQV